MRDAPRPGRRPSAPRLAPPGSQRMGAARRSRSAALYASLAGPAILLGWLVATADGALPADETRVCTWNILAIDVRSGPPGERWAGDSCELSADGVRITAKILDDEPATMSRLSAATGASSRPIFDVSPPKLLSLPYLLFRNRLPFRVYAAPSRQRGLLLAEIAGGSFMLAGSWTSERPLSASQVDQIVRIRLNPNGDQRLMTLWIKLNYLFLTALACLALAPVWYSRPLFRWIDKWWNVRSAAGLLIYAGLLPGAALAWAWFVFLALGCSSELLLAALLAAILCVQVAFNLTADRRPLRPVVLSDSLHPKVYETLSARTGAIDFAGAEIPINHAIELKGWFPRAVDCLGCGLRYVVYVPMKSEERTMFETKPSEFSPWSRDQLSRRAADTAPQLVNGCIRCGRPLAAAPSTWEAKRDDLMRPDAKIGWTAIVGFALALVVARYTKVIAAFCERLPWLGGLLRSLIEGVSESLIVILCIPLLFLMVCAATLLADRNVRRGPPPHRMTVCPWEGLVFEDIAAGSKTVCPSCGAPLEPLRRFYVLSRDDPYPRRQL